MVCGSAPSALICACSTCDDWIRIFRPLTSVGNLSGLFALITLKPLSQYASPVMPLVSSFLKSAFPAGPCVTL